MEKFVKSSVPRHDSCTDDVSLEDTFYPNDELHRFDKTQPNSAKQSKEDIFTPRSNAVYHKGTQPTQQSFCWEEKCRLLGLQQSQDVLCLSKDVEDDLGKNTSENINTFDVLDNKDAIRKVKSKKPTTEEADNFCADLGVKIYKHAPTVSEKTIEDVSQEYGRKVKDVTFKRSESFGVDVDEGCEQVKKDVSVDGAPARCLGHGDIFSARCLCALALVILTLAVVHQHSRISVLEGALVKLTDMKQLQTTQELQLFQENLDVKKLSQSRNGKTVLANDERIERSLGDTHAGSVKTKSPDGIRSLPGSSRDAREDERGADVHTERHDDQQQTKGGSQPDDNNNVYRDDGLTRVDEDNDRRDKSPVENSEDEMVNDNYNWFDVTRTQPLLTRNKRDKQEKMNKYCEDIYCKKGCKNCKQGQHFHSIHFDGDFYSEIYDFNTNFTFTDCFTDDRFPTRPKACKEATLEYPKTDSPLAFYRPHAGDKGDNKNILVNLNQSDGLFTLLKSGIFFLHFNITLVDESRTHSISLALNNQTVLACPRGGFRCSVTNVRDSNKYRICSIDGVLELKTGDVLQLRTSDPHTTVRLETHRRSKFSLVLLQPHNPHKPHKPRGKKEKNNKNKKKSEGG